MPADFLNDRNALLIELEFFSEHLDLLLTEIVYLLVMMYLL